VAGTKTPQAPDRQPTVMLRIELARRRREGEPFETAWPAALEIAADTVAEPESKGNGGVTNRTAQMRIWERHERAWKDGYEREGPVQGWTSLFTEPPEETRRSAWTVIA
jgi:hypothetical protein